MAALGNAQGNSATKPKALKERNKHPTQTFKQFITPLQGLLLTVHMYPGLPPWAVMFRPFGA